MQHLILSIAGTLLIHGSIVQGLDKGRPYGFCNGFYRNTPTGQYLLLQP